MKSRNKFHYAFIILLAVSLIRGIAGPGINASPGVFLTPVSKSLGIGIGTLSVYLSISSIATLFLLPLMGNLFQKLSVKTVAFAGILLQTLAFTALGFMSSVWAWYILAIPLAAGTVILVNLLGPLLIQRWFSKRIGLVMGLMMMLTSLLGSVFQPTFTTLIENKGWQSAYIYFGIFALIAMLLICLLLKNSPRDRGLVPYGESEFSTAKSAKLFEPGVPAKKALKSPAFYSLLLFMIVLTGFASFQQHIATFGLGIGLDMNTIGNALSISMVGSAIGSVIIGIFSDKVGIVSTSIGVLVVGTISVILFLIGGSGIGYFIAATFLHGLATSSIGVVAPLLVKKYFGDLDFDKLFSSVMIGSPLASIVLMPAYGFLYDTFGNYRYVFFFLVAALVIASVCLLLGLRNSRKLQ